MLRLYAFRQISCRRAARRRAARALAAMPPRLLKRPRATLRAADTRRSRETRAKHDADARRRCSSAADAARRRHLRRHLRAGAYHACKPPS